MHEQRQLKVGRISYLNSVPYFELLETCGFSGILLDGVPSALNHMLSDGQIDASLSSSIEYARHWQEYIILPGHSISSINEVKSVLFFSARDLQDLSGQTVYLTGESATSICLLKIVLETFHGQKDIRYVTTDESLENLVARNESVLLIGDRALKMANSCPVTTQCYDLGTLWFQATKLPFVYALWMIRKEAVHCCSDKISDLQEQLTLSRDRLLSQMQLHTAKAAARTGFTTDLVLSYWQTINYQLDEAHIKGLQLFYTLAEDLGLLKEKAQLFFFESGQKIED
jgi:chorismate dehydratase